MREFRDVSLFVIKEKIFDILLKEKCNRYHLHTRKMSFEASI